MTGRRLQTVRQHLVVTLPDQTIEVATRPFDHDLFAITRKKHDWPTAEENPVGYLTFLAWSAARREGAIGPGLTWEVFKAQVEDISESEPEPVTPTQPGPGPG